MDLQRLNQIMSDMLDSETNFEMVGKFLYNEKYLDDFKIIVSSDGGSPLPEYFGNKKFDDKTNAGVYSIFSGSKLFFLDKTLLSSPLHSKVDVDIDYTISFDTQAISYFDSMVKQKNAPAVFIKALNYIVENDLNLDLMPYFIENSSKLCDNLTKEATLDTLKSYQLLRSLDRDHYLKQGKIRSSLSESINQAEIDALVCASENFHQLYQASGLPTYEYPLIWLIHIADIYIGSNKSPSNKLNDFLRCCHDKFHNMPLRYINIAYLLFNKKSNFMFFRKIQKGRDRKDLLKDLENMAWDLHHLHWLEDNKAFYDKDLKKFAIKMILTFDNGLVELIKLKAVKALAYSLKQNECFPMYTYAEDDSLKSDIAVYFSPELIKERADKLKNKELNAKALLEKTKNSFLENSLSEDSFY